MRHMRCPDCGRVASVPDWCSRPICVHTWTGCAPEIWDADDTGANGGPIELAPNEEYRSPGKWWAHMEPFDIAAPV
jgi:hypothetical protein